MVALDHDALPRYGDTERSSYLGFQFAISQSAVHVTTPNGRHLGCVRTLSADRKLVKAYRKPSPLTLGASATGHNRKDG